MSLAEQTRAGFQKVWNNFGTLKAQLDQLAGQIKMLASSGVDEIDQIEGRRIPYFLHGEQTFTVANLQQAGQAIAMQISQDGPFIWTHYPLVVWRPTAPNNATLLGIWRPVTHFPLYDQGVDAGAALDLNSDIISISWQVTDGGSQRNLQNAALPPLFSSPYKQVELPKRMLFTPNSVVNFIPTYRAISFNNGDVPATDGNLEVMLPGYRIINL